MPITMKNCVAAGNKLGNFKINGVLYDTMEEANAALLADTMRPLAGSISSAKKTAGSSDKSLSMTDKIDKQDSTRS